MIGALSHGYEALMTHAGAEHGSLGDEVGSFIRERFPEGVISDVSVRRDVAEDGEAILLVTAVFEGSTDSFLERKPVGLMRMLRTRLLESEEPAFPLLSFVSAAEARR